MWHIDQIYYGLSGSICPAHLCAPGGEMVCPHFRTWYRIGYEIWQICGETINSRHKDGLAAYRLSVSYR